MTIMLKERLADLVVRSVTNGLSRMTRKFSRTVLRGERGSNPSDLPDLILEAYMKANKVEDILNNLVNSKYKSSFN